MRIRVFGFGSDTNKPPSPGGLMASVLAGGISGVLLFQQITEPKKDGIAILILAAAFLSTVSHLIYQLRGLYRQRRNRSESSDFMHKDEPRFPGAEENRYCPYCGRRVAEDYEFCNTCGKKLP